MEPAEIKEPYLLFREKLKMTAFQFFRFDVDLTLTPECHQIIDFITNEFYFKQKNKNKHFYVFKKFLFNRDYRAHPGKYPALINKDSLKPENFSAAVPGTSVESSFIIGYFKELKNPTGGTFLNFFGQPIESLTVKLDSVRLELHKIIDIFAISATNPDLLSLFGMHCDDLDRLFDICGFVAELFNYAKTANLPQLKSGHLISLISGMRQYFIYLQQTFVEQGFAVVSLDNSTPILSLTQKLLEALDSALLAVTMDLVSPIFSTMECKIESIDGRLRLSDNNIKPDSFFTRLFDFLLDGDKKAEPPLKRPSAVTVNKPTGYTRVKEKDILPKTPEISVLEERIIDSQPFIELHTALSKFAARMKNEMSPDINPNGQILNVKQGFDQFDLPEHGRDNKFTSVVLSGRLSSSDVSSKINDPLVIKSTYWLYDRITGIMKYYRFSKEGALFEKAKLFVDDTRTLFYPSKNEYNEIRTYGTFPQFQINMKRIFSSRAIQSRYQNHIEYISELLDRAVQAIRKEETAKLQNSPKPIAQNQ